jgi:uncharacterized protein (TIGR02118 family)
MIKLSVLYPATEGATFDHDYYRTKHVPLCQETWGVSDSNVQVDTGISGPYVAAVHLSFADNDAMGAALGHPGTPAIQADVANYTTIEPIMQISSYDA